MKYRITSAIGCNDFYMDLLLEHGFSVKKIKGKVQYYDRIYVTISSLKALHELCDIVKKDVIISTSEDVPCITIDDYYVR